MALSRAELQRLVEVEAALQGVDPAMAMAVAQQESAFDPTARSPKGAYGIMQLMPGTAKHLGVDPNDPADNIAGGVKYLAQLSKRYDGDRERTLAAYNAGPGVVDSYKGIPPFKETRGYVAKIMGSLGPRQAEAAPLTRLQEIEAELARREQAAPPPAQNTPPLAQAAPPRPAQGEPPSDLTIDIGGDGPPESFAQAVQGIPPLDPHAASRMLADRSPLPSGREQARTIGAMAVPAATGTMGAMAGGALGGPAGAVAGGIAGGVYGGRLNKQLGLTDPEQPLVEKTVLGPIYPSDALNVGVPLAMRAAAPIATKVGNAISGVTKPAQQKLMDLAERYGVRLSYGDVTRGSVAPKVETILENIPGSGAGGFRVGQQADVAQAGARMNTDLQDAMIKTPWRNIDQVRKVAGHYTSQGKAARALLEELDNAGDDWARVVQASGKLSLFQDRLRADQLYNRVEKLAAPLGNVPVMQTLRAIDDAVDDVQRAVLPSAEAQREVGGLLSRARDAIATVPTAPIPDTSYARMRRLRSDLGDMQRTATEPATARVLGQVKTALEQDMATFADQSGVPALKAAHRQADQFYRARVVKYREGQLAKAMERDLPDEIYGKFVQQDKGARAQEFYNGLDTKGQAAVRYGMAREAYEKATDGALDVFSPAKYSQSLGKIQEASGVFFKGQPQWEMDGFRKLMAHAQRAGQYAENPPTGNRLLVGGLLAGGSVALDVASMGKLFASARGLQALFMTRPGRNFLLASSDLQPGSSAFTRRVDQFLRSPAWAPVMAGASGGRQGRQPGIGGSGQEQHEEKPPEYGPRR